MSVLSEASGVDLALGIDVFPVFLIALFRCSIHVFAIRCTTLQSIHVNPKLKTELSSRIVDGSPAYV